MPNYLPKSLGPKEHLGSNYSGTVFFPDSERNWEVIGESFWPGSCGIKQGK